MATVDCVFPRNDLKTETKLAKNHARPMISDSCVRD